METVLKEGVYSNTTTYQIDATEEDYLYIQPSQIIEAGNGLYTAIPIYKDEVIAIFKGEILSTTEVKNREAAGKDRYFINLLQGGIMDCMDTYCFAKYANDVIGSTFKVNAKITLDEYDNICLVAIRTIKSNEEIFCSYGSAYWKKCLN